VRAEAWEHNAKVLVAYGAQPGAQSYIRARLAIFDPRFRKVLEELGPAEITPGTGILDPSGGAAQGGGRTGASASAPA